MSRHRFRCVRHGGESCGLARFGDAVGGVNGGAGGGVHLGGVVQFDDFGGFEVFRGLGGKVVGQYGGDREVRCDEDLLGFGLRTVGDGGFDLGEFLVGPAGGADHHVHAWPIRVSTLFRLTDGTVNSTTTSVLSVVIWVRSSPASNASASCVSSALFTASTTCEPMRPFAPTTETLIMSSSLSTRTCPAMYPGRFSNRQSAYHRQALTPIPRPQNQAPSDEPNREVELPLMSRTVKKTPEAFF